MISRRKSGLLLLASLAIGLRAGAVLLFDETRPVTFTRHGVTLGIGKNRFSYGSWQSEHMLYVFDSCESGGMEVLADHDGSFVAASSRLDEQSQMIYPEDAGGEEYGVFTYSFLVENETDKGCMGGQCTEDAFDYTQLETSAYVDEPYNPDINPLYTEQHPVKAKKSWAWWIRGGSIVPLS